MIKQQLEEILISKGFKKSCSKPLIFLSFNYRYELEDKDNCVLVTLRTREKKHLHTVLFANLDYQKVTLTSLLEKYHV